MSRKVLVVMITLGLLGSCPLLLRAQNAKPSIDSTIEIIRTGMQADKSTIIIASMNLSDKDGAAFWPIYRQYEHERSMVDDGRVTVLKEYTAKFPTLTDTDAKAMVQRMFDYDSRIAALKKRYFKKFNKVVPALTVSKFFQLEHRIDLLMDMKVESALAPLTVTQPITVAQPTAAAESMN